MKLFAFFAAAAAAALVSGSASAGVIHIDFDDVAEDASVDGFYSGGTDSEGNSGPNLGVEFVGATTTSAYGVATSPPNLAFNDTSFSFFNVYGGFSAISFWYGAFEVGSLNIFEGVDGTGALLGSVPLSANMIGPFDFASLDFAGTGHSVVFGGAEGTIGIDDLRLTVAGVPEPAQWALMIAGFGLAGAALRRRESAPARA